MWRTSCGLRDHGLLIMSACLVPFWVTSLRSFGPLPATRPPTLLRVFTPPGGKARIQCPCHGHDEAGKQTPAGVWANEVPQPLSVSCRSYDSLPTQGHSPTTILTPFYPSVHDLINLPLAVHACLQILLLTLPWPAQRRQLPLNPVPSPGSSAYAQHPPKTLPHTHSSVPHNSACTSGHSQLAAPVRASEHLHLHLITALLFAPIQAIRSPHNRSSSIPVPNTNLLAFALLHHDDGTVGRS